MGWSVGYDSKWNRDIGYGVPAYCDHPGCRAEIDRGLSYVCCGEEPYGGDYGCGRYFCSDHRAFDYDEDDNKVCAHEEQDYISEDHPDWIRHKLTDQSWQRWRDDNPIEVEKLRAASARSETVCEHSRPSEGLCHECAMHRIEALEAVAEHLRDQLRELRGGYSAAWKIINDYISPRGR